MKPVARPILMSAPMVRALLEGRKTQTRSEAPSSKERLSDMALRNVRAWAANRPDMSGSQAIVDAIDELLERRAHETPAPRDITCSFEKLPVEAVAREKLCEDCPPADYPTDKTRCASCPRRAEKTAEAPDSSERA